MVPILLLRLRVIVVVVVVVLVGHVVGGKVVVCPHALPVPKRRTAEKKSPRRKSGRWSVERETPFFPPTPPTTPSPIVLAPLWIVLPPHARKRGKCHHSYKTVCGARRETPWCPSICRRRSSPSPPPVERRSLVQREAEALGRCIRRRITCPLRLPVSLPIRGRPTRHDVSTTTTEKEKCDTPVVRWGIPPVFFETPRYGWKEGVSRAVVVALHCPTRPRLSTFPASPPPPPPPLPLSAAIPPRMAMTERTRHECMTRRGGPRKPSGKGPPHGHCLPPWRRIPWRKWPIRLRSDRIVCNGSPPFLTRWAAPA